MTRQKFIWYLRQLLPLRYESTYWLSENGEDKGRFHSVWRMWMGRSFAHVRTPVVD